jgi:hypothetical protein
MCSNVSRKYQRTKRLIDDVFLYRNITYNDLEQTVNTVPTSHDIYEILQLYKS